MTDESERDLYAIAVCREVGEAPAHPDRHGRHYRVGDYWFSHEDAWMTAVLADSGRRVWTTRFERHARVIGARGGRLIAVGMQGDELCLFEIDAESGEGRLTERLGFGAYDLVDTVHVHGGIAYVPGPGRIVGIDVEGGAIAWEQGVVADKVLPLVASGDEVFAAYSSLGTSGHETVLARVDPRGGRVEPITRMAADCHGLLANDHAFFAKVESGSGNIPFGRHAYAALPRGGGAPLIVTGEGRAAARGRFFVMVQGERVQLVTSTDRGLVLSGGRLASPAASSELRISGSRAYLRAVTPGRPWLELDLDALARHPALPPVTASRPLLDAAFAPADRPPRAVARVEPEARARAAHAVTVDDPIATLPASFARFRERVIRSRDLVTHLDAIGMTFLEPPGRWSARMGRDPSLVDFARLSDGDHLAFYAYPARQGGMPVVRLPAYENRLEYVAQDFDAFLSRWLAERARVRPHLAAALREILDVELERIDVPPPPEWFGAAHEDRAASWDAAFDDTDPREDLGRERMLVALAIDADGPRCQRIRDALAAVYARLGWDFQRRAVLQTWNVETR